MTSDNEASRERNKQLKTAGKEKKPYKKPAFKHERVFETQALACGKIVATGQCQFSQKSS